MTSGASSACGAPARRYLPHVLLATFAVAVAPTLVVSAMQLTGWLSGVVSFVVAMCLALAAGLAGSAIWSRRPGSRDVVFADLMLWGWIRRLRTERRLADATQLLGVEGLDGRSDRRVELLEQLATALEARDPYTHGHSRRVARHAHMIAQQMGLSSAQVATIRSAAALHDVGKVETPRAVLNKPGRLTDEEFATIKRHPVDGAEMVAVLGDRELTAIVRHHHERLDGRGYPDGLAGEQIPLGARIIAVADTFDAITSSRSYRRALAHKRAIDTLKREAGAQLDAAVVSAFLSYYSGRKRSLPWLAVLADGPQRGLAWLAGALHGAGAAPLAKGLSAVGVSALVGGSLLGPAPSAGKSRPAAPERASAGAPAVRTGVTPPARPAAGDPGSRAVPRPSRRRRPVSSPPRGERRRAGALAPGAPEKRSPGTSTEPRPETAAGPERGAGPVSSGDSGSGSSGSTGDGGTGGPGSGGDPVSGTAPLAPVVKIVDDAGGAVGAGPLPEVAPVEPVTDVLPAVTVPPVEPRAVIEGAAKALELP